MNISGLLLIEIDKLRPGMIADQVKNPQCAAHILDPPKSTNPTEPRDIKVKQRFKRVNT